MMGTNKQQLSVSVIVVGYNSSSYLRRCFDALSTQEYDGDVQILFVDNSSSDGSVSFVRESYPAVEVISSGSNMGYAGGNNLGAQAANGDVLVFLNPDTEVSAGWLCELVKPLADDGGVGITTSKLLLASDPDLVNAFGNTVSVAGITTCGCGGVYGREVTSNANVAAASGAAMAIRADLFWSLNGFDENFWMYLEDTDLSWRARMIGYRCTAVATSIVAHQYAFQLSPSKVRRMERNRYQMIYKNLSVLAFLSLLPVLFLSEALSWGWVLLNGPRCSASKVLAIYDAALSLPRMTRLRRMVQSQRTRSDAEVLQLHVVMPEISSISPGRLSSMVELTVSPIIRYCAQFGFWIIRYCSSPSRQTEDVASVPGNRNSLKHRTS